MEKVINSLIVFKMMKKMKKFRHNLNFKKILILSLFLAMLFVPSFALANNLSIDNFEIYSNNDETNTITYSCDISWDNSWRNTINNDAVWVFLKYSTDSGQTWKHASMSASGTNPYGFNVPYNFEAVVPTDEKGFFLQRTDLTSGSVSSENVRFVWDYDQDGLTDEEAKAATTINKIFGIEVQIMILGILIVKVLLQRQQQQLKAIIIKVQEFPAKIQRVVFLFFLLLFLKDLTIFI